MNVSIQRFFLLTIGLLFCVIGCTRDRGHMLMPDHISHATEVMESTDTKASFEHDILPILTARCALAGCHVADGPHGLDFRTYESFIAGGEHGPAFSSEETLQESAVVEQIVSGSMPPGGPPLSVDEIQVFVDWINHQEPQDHIVMHDDHHDAEEDEHVDMDDEHDEDIEDDHDDTEDEHDDIDDAHDEDDNGHDDDMDDDDNGDNGHADDEHDEDNGDN